MNEATISSDSGSSGSDSSGSGSSGSGSGSDAGRASSSDTRFDHPLSDDASAFPISFDWSVLTHPVVLRGIVASAALLMIALWPRASGSLLGPIAAVGLAVTGALTLWSARRLTGLHRLIEIVYSVALIAGAVLFFAYRDSATDSLVRLIAVFLAVNGLRSLALWRADSGSAMSVASAVGALTAALLLWFFPGPLMQLGLAAIGFIDVGLVVIAIMQLSSMTPEQRRDADTLSVTYDWFRSRALDPEPRDELYDKVIFEGDNANIRLARFYTLMGFAAVIATMGVITDSTAVVIGAMLIAPLMTPLMGIATSLSMGWPRRLQRMALIALSGMVWAILIGFLLGAALSSFVDVGANSQIQARITPTLLDLITAIAAGGAGAYGLSRSDVSDSLPGVAIAISLVPPLTVVGICWSAGSFREGNGALLLFLTNAVAIMLVGAFTFVITGISPIGRSVGSTDRVRQAAIAIFALGAIVLAGLLLNGRQLTTQQLQEGKVRESVRNWLGDDTEFEVTDISLDDPKVIEIDLSGPAGETMPATDTLANTLADELNRSVSVEIRTSLYEAQTASSSG